MLTVENLRKSYGSTLAVDGVSFSVTSGEIVGLVGPNGAGKSTTIRMIMGILAPNGGSISYSFGHGDSAAMDKTQIGYLPEDRGLYDDVKVLDNLVYLGTLKGQTKNQSKQEALRWLAKVGLEDRAQHKLEKLSKGMQQKIQFIGAVIHQPKLLMLDEPFSGLDPVNQDLFTEMIHELQRAGTAILLSAHQMSVIEELCDRVFFINDGKQVLYGSIAEIKDGFKEHTVRLTYSKEEDASFLRALDNVEVVREEPGSIILRHTGPQNTSELLQLVSQRLTLGEISIQKPSLHSIFVQTVKRRGGDIEETEII